MNRKKHNVNTMNMSTGSIPGRIVRFALPLMLGNVFQMLYNTVDSIIVGRFVSTQALAAVGSTTMIVNLMVVFFSGFSIGAGVVVARYFGAEEEENLHTAVETTMAFTLLFCVFATVVGIFTVRPMLRLMATPEDVFPEATLYLTIYFAGVSGLLIYNVGGGILRAVGDTRRPLYFLILTSVLNIFLDLLFVLVFHAGIAGVAFATILSQAVSAGIILLLLSRADDVYRLTWNDLRISRPMFVRIFRIALPTALQGAVTTLSNIVVQSYINFFGSGVMAGWSSYNKLDQFLMLPTSSLGMAATTFVSQNVGAGRLDRARAGCRVTLLISGSVCVFCALLLFFLAEPAIALFSTDPQVIAWGALFIHVNVFLFVLNSSNHTLAGALRGLGDSQGPMFCMLGSYVVIRQIYLFVITRFVANTPVLVGLGYPVGWVCCFVTQLIYYRVRIPRYYGNVEAAPLFSSGKPPFPSA
jgi:putative MATE family efflux protein